MMRRPLDRPLLQALVLAAGAGLLGLVVNAARPAGIELARPVLAASGASDAATCAPPVGTSTETEGADVRVLWGGVSGCPHAGEPAESGECAACDALAEGTPR
jgi:hypothetical protein